MSINKYLVLFVLLSIFLYQCKSDDDFTEEIIEPNENVGVYIKNEFFEGYTLISPVVSNNSYLINMEGYVVKKWISDNIPLAVYLDENGHLLRTYKVESDDFNSGGKTGGIEMFDFEGNVIWDWQYCNSDYCLHHDISILPNGNILATVWDRKTADDAIANGRNPDLLIDNEVWSERIIEIKPVGFNDAEIVWEWSLWNHLIQNFDDTKLNFGVVSEHPDLIDLNFTIGDANLNHINSIFYIDSYDQIIMSSRRFNELFIIDHSTSTTEASGDSGGNYNKGGRLLYRWGNPSAYGSGSQNDQRLFGQHDVRYISGLPSNGGNFLVFNNNRFENASSIDEFLIPQNSDGSYNLLENTNNLPLDYEWSYMSPEIYAPRVSGAMRLVNGNTLITVGTEGLLTEINSDQEIVWSYTIPIETNDVFKCFRYSKTYPAFNNQELPILENTAIE
ncbi:aryl-sulfate sulfotransferase [Winogradskyella sp.]|uniref:aryl-sulfate sulfotransferase n=1 Tax=Winogradskyella sp. TaxID=1883156 RepID=UPI002616C008|nr:aryl-sulfate sulfotransferase [Winogradskyella sp.]